MAVSRAIGRSEVVVVSAASHTVVPVVLIVAGLAAGWLGCYLTGGTQFVMPHLFYVPVIVAASRFGLPGAVGVAVVAGVLAGPAVPLDVEAGVPQETGHWVIRMGFFVLVGWLVAVLTRHTLDDLGTAVADRRRRAEMEAALADGQFTVVYQPQVALDSGAVCGVEALVRWKHPERGLRLPGEFIEDAERVGTIIGIGDWVLREALRQAADWRERLGIDLTVSVNVCARQLEDPRLAGSVLTALRDAGVPPSTLQLEVTESALVADLERVTAALAPLRDRGVGIAVDDFGTGHSSLRYLHRFRPDVVKIDRSFVQGLSSPDGYAEAIVRGVIDFATSVGAQTVGEGIEDADHLALLAGLGCDIGQGFHLARPASAEEVEPLLGRRLTGLR